MSKPRRLSHSSSIDKSNNAIIVRRWIQHGLDKSAKYIQKALDDHDQTVGEYSQGKLTNKVASVWKKRIKEQLTILGKDDSREVTLDEAKEIYAGMFNFHNAGRKKIFTPGFVEEVRRRVEEHRGPGSSLLLTFDGFQQLCGDVADDFDRKEHGQPWKDKFNRCNERTFLNMLRDDLGYVLRGTSKSESLPFKHKEMSEIFVGKLLNLIKEHAVPPSLVLNFDETSVLLLCVGEKTYELPSVKDVRLVGSNDKRALTYTPVITAEGSVVMSQVILPGKAKTEETAEPMWRDAPHLGSHSLLVNHSGGKK